MNMEITSMLTLSTEHLAPDTQTHLMDESGDRPTVEYIPGVTAYPKEHRGSNYGWFIYFDKEVLELGEREIPKDLLGIAKLAFANSCQMVCMDSDGPSESSLSIYEY